MTREDYIIGLNKGFEMDQFYEFYKEKAKEDVASFEEFKQKFPFYLHSGQSMARFFKENDIKFTPTKLTLKNGTAVYF